jgi:phosphoglycerate dehydrogenase-like enzyme
MALPTVLVATPFLLECRVAWAEGFELVEPRALSSSSQAGVADRIEVIATGGDALDRTLVDRLPSLKLVACFSTGYAGIDVDHLRSRGVMLTTAAGVNAHDVADHAIALLLGWWHRIPEADRAVRQGQWRQVMQPRGSLRGKRIGIVGLGRVGLQIAGRAEALGLRVSWWGPREKPDSSYPRAESLHALAKDSDILMIASRATPESGGQIDAEILAALGPEGLLVNVSRGFLVDERALIDALDARKIAGAALDVFDREPPDVQVWNRFTHVVLSPHIAGYTREAGVAMFGQLRENIRRHFAGEPLLTALDD